MCRSTLPIISLVLLLIAAPATAAPFTSSKGYSITPPKGWTANRSGTMGTDAMFIAKPKNGVTANINVVVTKAAPGDTIQAARAQINQTYPRLFNQFKWIARGNTTVDGAPALFNTVNYSIGTPPHRMWAHQIVALKNGMLYSFTCTTLNKDKHSLQSGLRQRAQKHSLDEEEFCIPSRWCKAIVVDCR